MATVRPRARAWIETRPPWTAPTMPRVRPRSRAWIETIAMTVGASRSAFTLARGRGLKPRQIEHRPLTVRSPSREARIETSLEWVEEARRGAWIGYDIHEPSVVIPKAGWIDASRPLQAGG